MYILCYVTLIIDDTSEDFGHIEINSDKTSTSFIVYIWLRKYWLSRSLGHALFASSLYSMDFLSIINNSSEDMNIQEKDDFLFEIKNFTQDNIQIKYSNIEYLIKTISLLGELQSLSFDETKEIILQLINYLTCLSCGSLIHVLLWLIANYQIANDEERSWIQNTIHTMGKYFFFEYISFLLIIFSRCNY